MTGMGLRTAAWLGAMASAAVALAACGTTEYGPVIGTPAVASPPLPVASTNQAVDALEQRLVSELNQIDLTPSDGEPTQITAEINALMNDHTLIVAEQMDSLRRLGAGAVAERQKVLDRLIGDIQSARLGSSQAAALLSLVHDVQHQLQAVGAKIATDSLEDVLLQDVRSVDPSTRVGGLIDPLVHVGIGAGIMSVEASSIAGRAANLGRALTSSAANYSTEKALLARVESQASAMQSTARALFSQVLQLTPAGYPANVGQLQALKGEELGTENGPASSARAELSQITTCMADDGSSPPRTC